MSIRYELTDSPADMEQIIALQQQNHLNNVDKALWATEGFVTLSFNKETLLAMRGEYGHVVAKSDEKLVGYALVLLREKRSLFPFLDTMFEEIDAAVFKGENVKEKRYFVMGQICVDTAYRGQGVFRALYEALRAQMKPDFDFVVTEVSKKNNRSVQAHRRVGFRDINDDPIGEAGEWEVIAWDWA